ncbi:MAG: RagB/SusD family nutrient uptake outer membrane protein [Cyclobacteriaceae bacterium]|nr:RagB/SusD family nutrient uptake outer membrane protein [Cyclobacteriaceae bacterium]
MNCLQTKLNSVSRKGRWMVLLAICLAMSCNNILEPEPIDLLTDDIVLNEPSDVPLVEIGLYSAFRPIIPSLVIAGDFTADMLVHNGTFSQYRELGTKQITSANASVTALWGSVYNTIYIANFIIERLPEVAGVRSTDRDRVMATAHFLRGYAYFVALQTYGGVPKVTSTDIEVNRNMPRASAAEILELIQDDFNFANGKLPATPVNAGFAGAQALNAAWAKLFLYQESWPQAEAFATAVIASDIYQLEASYATIVNTDFTREAIFEVGYTLADDPGTNATIGLNNLFVGRREIIPSNQTVLALASVESGDRFASISFNPNNLVGNDNGWSVAKYGTADANNNNVTVFRLAEMYLIRAEARARQGNVTGTNSAAADINVLRTRANAPTVGSVNQTQMLTLIENERVYELAYEGSRWYDLVRTNRAATVMPAFNSNWRSAYERWPIPQREIQSNPALVGNQNPGY